MPTLVYFLTFCSIARLIPKRPFKLYRYSVYVYIEVFNGYPQVYLLAHDIQTLLAELETDFLTIFLEGYYDHSLKSELMQSRKSDKKLAKVHIIMCDKVTVYHNIWWRKIMTDFT